MRKDISSRRRILRTLFRMAMELYVPVVSFAIQGLWSIVVGGASRGTTIPWRPAGVPGQPGADTGQLSTCTSNLSTCTTSLGTCPADLGMCQTDLAACQAEPVVFFPGDGVDGPPLSYHDNGDGTFTDNNTLFMWEVKGTSGGIHDVNNTYTWSDAFAVFLAVLNTSPCFAGHCDWRIPNVKELQSIVDYSKLPPSSLPGSTAAAPYWSSTTYAGLSSFAWFVNFTDGTVRLDGNKLGPGRVRAVRGGR